MAGKWPRLAKNMRVKLSLAAPSILADDSTVSDDATQELK